MYITYSQLPDYIATIFAGTIGVAVRANSESSTLIGAIRSDLAAFNPDQAIHTEQWMNEVVAESLASRRFSMTVLGAFALVALVLAVVGIYGTVSYIVRQRSHEIGLRAALGGRPRDLLLMVLGEGGRLAVAGIVAGVAGGLATTRLLTTLLFQVSPTDAMTFVAASAALLAVVLAACYLPARRASRIDPMLALRQD
jgi:putative ABC transport system permease protein